MGAQSWDAFSNLFHDQRRVANKTEHLPDANCVSDVVGRPFNSLSDFSAAYENLSTRFGV